LIKFGNRLWKDGWERDIPLMIPDHQCRLMNTLILICFRAGVVLNQNRTWELRKFFRETDEWEIYRNGAGASLKWWKTRAGTPEHIDFLMTTREIWEKEYREYLLELNRERLGFDACRGGLEKERLRVDSATGGMPLSGNC
jgi:hypothetical protein